MPSIRQDKDSETEYNHYESRSGRENFLGGKDHGLDVAAVLEDKGLVPSAASLNEKEDKETRRIVRKIDMRLLPVLATIYSFALIDRVNLPNARIAGMGDDLQLSVGSRYTLISMIFFIPYVIFQFPANIVIRKLGASLWLGSCVVAWGAVTIGLGFTRHWEQVLGCRILLGCLEVSSPYHLADHPTDCAIGGILSGMYIFAIMLGFANILAYGFSQMKGVGNLNGWRWIFIMEGIITVVLGVLGYVAIIDFPDKATNPGLILRKPFLTLDEAKIVLTRIDRDRGDAVVDKLTAGNVFRYLRDWKIWEYAWLYLLNNTVTYSFGFFLPIILQDEMGYSTALSQVLSFPPYVAAAPWMFATAWCGDRYRRRGLILIFNCAVAIIGVAMMGFSTNVGARYTGVFLGVCGANSNVPTILSYMHNNIVGQMKRSVASALLIGGGAIGGIAASNIFRQQDAPKYTPAMITVICTQVISILHVLKNFIVYSKKNSKAEAGKVLIEGKEGFRHTL